MNSHPVSWLPSGRAGLAAMQRLIEQARHNIQLQTYIFRNDESGRRMRALLTAAAERGVRVRLLIDALGSMSLPADFFAPLIRAGGELRWFNPLNPQRLVYRNHRKLLAADRKRAVIGGFNIGNEYGGDGIESGWLDLGLRIRGELAGELASAFDRMYALATDPPRRLARLRAAVERRQVRTASGQLLLSGPGRGPNPLKAALMRDLDRAGQVRLISPYFLPTWALRRRLMKTVRRGGRVQLLLPSFSDVAMAQHASRHLYDRLLRAGVEIFEYQPQMLHAKLVIADRVVYAGSANFNTRSLHIDFELMVRLTQKSLVEQANGMFDHYLQHAARIDRQRLARSTGWWTRLRQRLAYLLMARLDPWVAQWLWGRFGRSN